MPGPRYRFGEFELDCTTFTLTSAGQPQRIRPKVFEVLRYLVEHRSRLVTKDELLDTLWTGQFVEEVAVAWAISHARRVLRQHRGHKTPIETVYGRGYRFTATVEQVRDPSHPHGARAPGFADDASGDYAHVARVAQKAGSAAGLACSYTVAARFYAWALEAQAYDEDTTRQRRAELLACLATTVSRIKASRVPVLNATQVRQLTSQPGYPDRLARAARILRQASHAPDPAEADACTALEAAFAALHG